MSLAAATREAVRSRPALYEALRAGVVNYTAAAGVLDVAGDREAIATALRRFADDLADEEPPRTDRSVTVRLDSSIDWTAHAETLLAVDGIGIGQAASEDATAEVDIPGETAVHVTGDVDTRLLADALARLRIAGIEVAAAGVADGSLVLVVSRRDGPGAVQVVESVAESGV